ncbi:MFS transporter [Protaetiibacter mangrovi]|nr:MFS transporter [Protaetiibacter mangrovi]
MPRALRPFRTTQYRVLATALALSLFGAGVWLIAVVFQIKRDGGGPIEVSWVASANAVGLVIAVLVGGAVADRVPQKLVLLTVEAVKLVLVAIIAVLALAGALEVWQLAVVSFVIGVADGFFLPAYSALLPAILPADQLLAANGFEGLLRPAVHQAAGPAVAAALIAVFSPAAAFAVISLSQLAAIGCLLALRRTAVRREVETDRHPVISLVIDVRDGFSYMVRTPWLLATLLYACLIVLVIMGPFEVLLPFAVTERTGGGAGSYAVVLAAFGLGGAIASVVVGSLRLPRRYLTIMNLGWGIGSLPLVVIAVTSSLGAMAAAAFVVGACYAGASVIWGTLLQRRVPPHMLGRVSSLDFFVSLALLPISMAVAGPVGELVGYTPVFLVAALVPPVLAVVAILAARMPRDELAHPLDVRMDA